jgi:hypothetical protein
MGVICDCLSPGQVVAAMLVVAVVGGVVLAAVCGRRRP